MSGELIDDYVLVRDPKEAATHFNKGNFGYPQKGGSSELDLIEAVYLSEHSRIDVVKDGRKVSFNDLFRIASTVIENFDIRYIVYRNLRESGFIVKLETGGYDLSVFPRGRNMANSRPIYMVRAVSEMTELDVADFAREISQTENRDKELLYGVVDEEGDVTYYNMSMEDPMGEAWDEPVAVAHGTLVGNRILVFDHGEGFALYRSGFFGKDIRVAFQLSMVEACWLMGHGRLEVTGADGSSVNVEDVREMGRTVQGDFDRIFKVYSDLRKRGLIVKTGFKYGTHFRVYEGDIEDTHAKYLLQVLPDTKIMMWPDISRTVRLSAGVKKEILFCRTGKKVQYMQFTRVKP